MFMESKKKSSTKRGCVSSDTWETANVISKLKGENLDDLVANFITDYVSKNLHVLLTENARLAMLVKTVSTNA